LSRSSSLPDVVMPSPAYTARRGRLVHGLSGAG